MKTLFNFVWWNDAMLMENIRLKLHLLISAAFGMLATSFSQGGSRERSSH